MENSLKKSQNVRFQSVGSCWVAKKIIRGATKHGLWGSNAKTWKYLPGVNFLYFFGSESYDAAWDR